MTRTSRTLWALSLSLLSISSLMLTYLIVSETRGRQPDDVYELLTSGKVVINVPDRWTGTDQEEFAELNGLRMPEENGD